MNKLHEENSFFTPSPNLHTELDLHSADLYRQLVEDFLSPNSHATTQLWVTPNTFETSSPLLFDHFQKVQLESAYIGTPNTESSFSNYLDPIATAKSDENSRSPLRDLDDYESYSPLTPDSEFRLFRDTSPSSSQTRERSEGSISFKNEITDATEEERKLTRRRERNRTSQRAFRARKEKYTQDLERHYADLRERYETLVELLRRITRLEDVSCLIGGNIAGGRMLAQEEMND